MTTRVRVLVVDDSVVARRIITDILQSVPDIEVVGVAASASIAFQKIANLSPDVVLLDVEMPEMDGIEAVTHIRAHWPRLPVIMCSSVTERGASITLRAIACGASDYVAKPTSLAGNVINFSTDVIAKVRALGMTSVGASIAPRGTMPPRGSVIPRGSLRPQGSIPPIATIPPRGSVAPRAPMVRRASGVRGRGPVTILAIGSSTGGPNALAAVFAALPRDLSVPVLVTQHMPPMFTKMLAERLTASSGFPTVEATHGEPIEAGKAYIAPGNYHMIIARDGVTVRIVLNQETPENSCRPAVDPLFRSVADVYGAGALVAVLTGMGHDGARGSESIVAQGGEVIIQDSASCVVPSMPKSVAAAVTPDGVYPIDQLGRELVARIWRRQSRASIRAEELVGPT